MRLFACLAAFLAVCIGCGARAPLTTSSPGVLAAATTPAAKGKNAGPIMAWHFLGTTQLAGNANATALRETLAQPASQFLVEGALDKLARAPGHWLGLAAATNASTWPLIRPLLVDALGAESVGTIHAGSAESAVVFALRVADAQAKTMEGRWKNWIAALGAGPASEIKVGSLAVQEAKAGGNAIWFRTAHANGWLLLGAGRGASSAFAEVVTRLGTPLAADSWLELKADGAQWAAFFEWPDATSWPDADLKITGKGPNLRTNARLLYSQPLDVKLEPWRLPTNTISDPLVSFTAVQGFRPWLARQTWWKQWGFPSTPNQAAAWTVGEIPFASYMGWDAGDVNQALRAILPLTPAWLAQNVPKIHFGDLIFQTNQSRLAWINLPIAEPFLSPATEKDPGFILGGLFPLVRSKQPPPVALLSQIYGRTNLVYYHWELTHERISGWRHVKNLYWMLAGYQPPPTNHTGEAWLSDTNVIMRLGNTATEITLTSPRELTAARSSAAGLTGGELVMFMRWLDDPIFPFISDPAIAPGVLRRQQGKAAAGTKAANATPPQAPAR